MIARAQELAALVERLKVVIDPYASPPTDELAAFARQCQTSPGVVAQRMCAAALDALEAQASALSDCDVKLVAAHDEIVGLRAKLAAAEMRCEKMRACVRLALDRMNGYGSVRDALSDAIDAALAAPDGKGWGDYTGCEDHGILNCDMCHR